MKIKQDFITNSSSSSFIIACKNDLSKEQIKQKLMELLKLPDKHPLSGIENEISSCLVNRLDNDDFTEYLENLYDKESKKIALDKFRNYPYFHQGSICDDNEIIEAFVCREVGLNYQDDEIIIKKEAGY